MIDQQLLARVGHLDQVAGVRRYRVAEGPADGLEVVQLYNRAGLELSVLPGAGLDIYDCRYRGTNLAFHTKNGLGHAAPGQTVDQFFHQWRGGFLATCGLANVGAAVEGEDFQPIHGRIAETPAVHVATEERWSDEGLVLSVSGEVHETRLYGRHLVLRRTIATRWDEPSFTIEDAVTNLAATAEPVLLLYHVNLGHPLADAGARLSTTATFGDRPDADGPPSTLGQPDAGRDMQVWSAVEQGERGVAVLVNPALALGLALEWDPTELPRLHVWHDPRPGGYVLAVEPATCAPDGRDAILAGGGVPVLEPYDTRRFHLRCAILDGTEAIGRYCASTGVAGCAP